MSKQKVESKNDEKDDEKESNCVPTKLDRS